MHIPSAWHRHYSRRRRRRQRVGHFAYGFHCYRSETHSVVALHFRLIDTEIVMNNTRITIKSYQMLQFRFRITYCRIRWPPQFSTSRRSIQNPSNSNVGRIGRSFHNSVHTSYFIVFFSIYFRSFCCRPNAQISNEWNENDGTILTRMLRPKLIKILEKKHHHQNTVE